MMPLEVRRWFVFGSGAGIQIAGARGSESLRVAAVRVPPGGREPSRMLRGTLTLEAFQQQPAGTWGAEYAAFLGKLEMRHVTATVVLPRHDVIVRPLSLPGVSDKDLEAAVGFQMDGLNPYTDEDVYSSWSRLPGTSTVLVAIARRDAVDRYAALFEEAGIKIAGFTCSAAAVYSAFRLFGAPPSGGVLAYDESGGPLEFYGESESRPVFSAMFDLDSARAAGLAAAELRIDPDTAPKPLAEVLGVDPAVAYAAALTAAAPGFSLSLNLLPAEKRQTSSRLRWIPVGAAGMLAILAVGAWAAYPGYEARRYTHTLEQQIAAIAPKAARAGEADKQIAETRSRIQLLDDARRRSKRDMDLIAELTRDLVPPTWINYLEIMPRQVIVGGQTSQAEPLLKVLDASPLFERSEFQGPPVTTAAGQNFRILTNREARQ